MNRNLMHALQYLHDDLDGRYDGAPDSKTLWMGEHVETLSQILDGESELLLSIRNQLRMVPMRESRP